MTRNAKEAEALPQLTITFSEQSECPERTVLMLKFARRFSVKDEPFAYLKSIVHEPVKDLKSEVFSTKPEPKANEPLRDLKSELFSAKPEAKASEPDRDLARPLV